MGSSTIKVKLPFSEIVSLSCIYQGLIYSYRPSNDHEQLLLLHIVELAEKLAILKERSKKHGTLKVGGSEALAFCQMWAGVQLRPDPYTQNLIGKITAAIDQYRKSPLRLVQPSNH